MNYTSTSENQTREIAAEFACKLKGGEFIEFIGDLGAGKTVFIRGIVEAFGSNVRVKSPTFTIMNEYPVDFKNIKKLIHIDLYRFNDKSELSALELEDYANDQTVICMEWPNIFGESIFKPTHRIYIDHVNEDVREIKVEEVYEIK